MDERGTAHLHEHFPARSASDCHKVAWSHAVDDELMARVWHARAVRMERAHKPLVRPVVMEDDGLVGNAW